MNKHLDQVAYEIAKEEYGNKIFSFDDLWVKLAKHVKASSTDYELKGELYSDIIQNTKFLYAGKQNWQLREFVTQDELKKNLSNSLYDFDKSLTEEDYEDMDELSEKFDEETGMYYDEDEDEAFQNIKDMANSQGESDEDENN